MFKASERRDKSKMTNFSFVEEDSSDHINPYQWNESK